MKNNEYFIVHKSILPDYFDLVIAAREMINNKKVSVSDACKSLNISRSTYYKYKDLIFKPVKGNGDKVFFEIKTNDEKGILSSILQVISESNGNIISINQDSPISGNASITIAIDASELIVTITELKEKIEKINGIKNIDIMGVM